HTARRSASSLTGMITETIGHAVSGPALAVAIVETVSSAAVLRPPSPPSATEVHDAIALRRLSDGGMGGDHFFVHCRVPLVHNRFGEPVFRSIPPLCSQRSPQ